jgi:hypothetical protein
MLDWSEQAHNTSLKIPIILTFMAREKHVASHGHSIIVPNVEVVIFCIFSLLRAIAVFVIYLYSC